MRINLQVSFALAVAVALTAMMNSRNADTVFAAGTPAITLSVQNTAPRQVEDATQKAVTRDYSAAWQTMAEALDENRADLLGGNFVGTANEKLTGTIDDQRKAGLHQRFVDKGHSVEAVFYSPEGSAMELHDVAQFHIDLLDGDKVIDSEDTTVHYVVLLTAAENSWKVRVLEAVPAF